VKRPAAAVAAAELAVVAGEPTVAVAVVAGLLLHRRHWYYFQRIGHFLQSP